MSPTAILRTLPVWAGIAWAAAAGPAAAQLVPGVDCERTTVDAERNGCAAARVVVGARAVEGAYNRLLATLPGPARAHLEADQATWRANAEKACAEPFALMQMAGDDAASRRRAQQDCMAAGLHARAGLLGTLPTGADYPFISDQARIDNGAIPGVRYSFSASYPRFDRPGVDFSAVNAQLANAARAALDEVKPKPDDRVEGRDQAWSLERSYSLAFATRDMVTVLLSHEAYLGGAHPSGAVTTMMVDLRTGRVLTLKDLFNPGAEDAIFRLAQPDLRRQFRERPGFDDALTPAKLRPLLREPDRWVAYADRLEILFNPYDIGPYAAGPYAVVLPYARLASVIRRDGPLASKLR